MKNSGNLLAGAVAFDIAVLIGQSCLRNLIKINIMDISGLLY